LITFIDHRQPDCGFWIADFGLTSSNRDPPPATISTGRGGKRLPAKRAWQINNGSITEKGARRCSPDGKLGTGIVPCRGEHRKCLSYLELNLVFTCQRARLPSAISRLDADVSPGQTCPAERG